MGKPVEDGGFARTHDSDGNIQFFLAVFFRYLLNWFDLIIIVSAGNAALDTANAVS